MDVVCNDYFNVTSQQGEKFYQMFEVQNAQKKH